MPEPSAFVNSRGRAGAAKRNGFRPHCLSAYAGSNPVVRIYFIKMEEIKQVKSLVRCRGKYLLLKKKKDIHPEHIDGWEVPGGKVKSGETLSQASQREIQEETGLSVKIVSELKPLRLETAGIKTYTHVYLAEAEEEKISLSSEHSAYIWIFPQEVDSLKKVIYKDLLKKYLNEAENITQ